MLITLALQCLKRFSVGSLATFRVAACCTLGRRDYTLRAARNFGCREELGSSEYDHVHFIYSVDIIQCSSNPVYQRTPRVVQGGAMYGPRTDSSLAVWLENVCTLRPNLQAHYIFHVNAAMPHVWQIYGTMLKQPTSDRGTGGVA